MELGSNMPVNDALIAFFVDIKKIDIESLKLSEPHFRSSWKGRKKKDAPAIPHSDEPGVYIFYSEDNKPIYVGKSERTLGSRVWGHWDDDKRDFRFNKKVSFLRVLVIPEEVSYLASSLESYLIKKLGPSENKKGI